MSVQQRRYILVGIGVVLAVVLFIVLRGKESPESVPTSGGEVYYTGPRRSKMNPNVWVTADGKVVPPPPGEQQIPANPSDSKTP